MRVGSLAHAIRQCHVLGKGYGTTEMWSSDDYSDTDLCFDSVKISPAPKESSSGERPSNMVEVVWDDVDEVKEIIADIRDGDCDLRWCILQPQPLFYPTLFLMPTPLLITR